MTPKVREHGGRGRWDRVSIDHGTVLPRVALDWQPRGVINHLMPPTIGGCWVTALRRIIADDRYPPSPRVLTVKAILARFRPKPVREPLPPQKVYANPGATAARSSVEVSVSIVD